MLLHVWDNVMVGGLVDLHRALGLPVLVPVCENVVVSSDSALSFARFHELTDKGQITIELLECCKDFPVVLGDDVSVNIADVGPEFFGVLVAPLKDSLIVMTSVSSSETSNEVRHLDSVKLIATGAWQLIRYDFLRFLIFGWYWE